MNGMTIIVDPHAALEAIEKGYLDIWLHSSQIYPGQSLSFAWAARYADSRVAGWHSASLNVFDDATGTHLASRTFAWPRNDRTPSSITIYLPGGVLVAEPRPPYLWPPNGSYPEPTPMLDDDQRQLLFRGFGDKTLRFELIGAGDRGDPIIGYATVTIRPEPITADWLTLSIAGQAPPASVHIGDPFVVSAHVLNLGHARMWAHLTPSRTDVHLGEVSRRQPPVDAPLIPAGRAEDVDVYSDTGEHWDWVDKPSYSAHLDDLARQYVFGVTAVFHDEFGNDYESVDAANASVTVSVPFDKLDAAMTAHSAFILEGVSTVVTIVGIIVGAAAPWAGVLIGVPGAAGMFVTQEIHDANAQIADDPPVPDPRYWERVEMREEPSKSEQPQPLRFAAWLSSLIQDGARVYARALGAQQAGADEAVQLHKRDLQCASTQIASAASMLAADTTRVLDVLRENRQISDQVAFAIKKSKNHLPFGKSERARLREAGLGEPQIKQAERAVRYLVESEVVDVGLLLSAVCFWALRTAEATLRKHASWARTLTMPHDNPPAVPAAATSALPQ
jgi:hypothetical protein